MAQRVKTDWFLFYTILLMVCFGLVMVYSASSVVAELKFRSSTYFVVRQLGWAVLGFGVLIAHEQGRETGRVAAGVALDRRAAQLA